MIILDISREYLRQEEPRTESRAVRALLMTGDKQTTKPNARYVEVSGPYQVMLNVECISLFTETYMATDNEKIGQLYLGQEELKIRRIGHDANMEQDTVHIGYKADMASLLLDSEEKMIRALGLLDTRAVLSVIPI